MSIKKVNIEAPEHLDIGLLHAFKHVEVPIWVTDPAKRRSFKVSKQMEATKNNQELIQTIFEEHFPSPKLLEEHLKKIADKAVFILEGLWEKYREDFAGYTTIYYKKFIFLFIPGFNFLPGIVMPHAEKFTTQIQN